jgi:hypothetical protein
LAFLLGLTSAANAQANGLSNGWCAQGAVAALVQGLSSTNRLLGVIPSCTITVYLHGTQTLATGLFSDSAGTQPLTNPFTASTTGFWQFYAANNAAYDVLGSGGIPPNVYLVPTLIPGSGGSGGGGSSPPINSVQFALNASGAFGSDSCITINPITHAFLVCGFGTGLFGLTDSTTGNTVYQTVAAGTAGYTTKAPLALPTVAGSCLTSDTAGNETFLGCLLLTGGTLTGPLIGTSATFLTVNGDVNPVLDPTVGDIGAKITHAVTAAPCNSQCTIRVPPGVYSYSTTIRLPLNAFNGFTLELDRGATLNYTGTGDAIYGYINTSNPTTSNLRITGGQLLGTAGATSAVHIQPTNTVEIDHMFLYGFSNAPAIWMEGVNAAWIEHNLIFSNQNGVYETPTYCAGATCGTGVSGTGFTPNAIHISNNTIVFNSHWAVWFADPVNGALTGALNDTITDNDLENNGSAGSTYGAVFAGRSTGMNISRNYFEGSPRQVVLGYSEGAVFFAAQGATVRENHFTEVTTTPYSIELVNANGTIIEGNVTIDSTMNSSNCFINGTPYVPASSGGEVGTVVRTNYVLLSGGGNYLCESGAGVLALTGAGSYSEVNSNNVWQIANSNYAVASAGTSETVTLSGNITTSSQCRVDPANATAGARAANVYLVATGPSTGTFYHPASITGTRWNLSCVPL